MTERPRTGDVVLHETFRAAPERIFSRMTDPAELVTWWGPDGFSTPEAVVDLTVGGGYRLTMQPPDGSSFHLAECIPRGRSAEAPQLHVSMGGAASGRPGDRRRAGFHPVDGGTVVILSHSGFATEERLLLHREGWTQAFEKLRTLVEASAP